MSETIKEILSQEVLQEIFPKERANDYFEALFGDADEGAFDIELGFRESTDNNLILEFKLSERPGHCLACNLTQGLPQVFNRHPVIDVDGVVKKVDELLGDKLKCGEWSLGYTEQPSRTTHAIPLTIQLQK